MDAGIIVAIISLIGTLGVALLQLRKWRAEAKKSETEISEKLMDKALQLSKHEVETLRNVNADLLEFISMLQNKISELEKELKGDS